MVLFNDNERRYFKKMFDLYDTDKGGTIDLSELKNLARHLGCEMSESALVESVRAVGYTGAEIGLDFDTFVAWLSQSGSATDEFASLKAKIKAQGSKTLNNEQIARLKEVFEYFDEDNSGSIDAGELVNVFASMGQDVTEDEMREMIDQVDEDGSGQIEFEEFLMLMCSNFGGKTFETDMHDAFTLVDPDGTGRVEATALFQLIKETTGGLVPDEEIHAIVASAEPQSEGVVEYMKWDSLWEACREES
mmetsp:Transcript_70472/g.82106  ORF Transcript_70472/g.82106 Transcript_70472/m.82106 type:complete len:248 (+) Transcript_70472:92-835(+)